MAAAISVRNLALTFGTTRILDAVNLEVEAGTLHALVGPNGAGKTTLLRAILGEQPHQGEIRLDLGRHGRLGYVPQSLALDPSLPLTVTDFLALMLGRRPALFGAGRRKRERYRGVLERTASGHLIDRPMSALSGGEMRRVLLAAALEPMPVILLLDEPTSQVDEAGLSIFEDLTRTLRPAVTILMVGHDLVSLARTADRVTVINRTVIHEGPAHGLADPTLVARLFAAGAIDPTVSAAA